MNDFVRQVYSYQRIIQGLSQMNLLKVFLLWPDVLANTLHPKKTGRYFDPYEVERGVNECDNPYQVVKAINDRDATKHLQGMSIQGNKSIVSKKVSKYTYKIMVRNWDTSEERTAYQDKIDRERW